MIGAMVRTLSRHPAVAPHVAWRTDALRWASDPKGPAVLSVVASSGDEAHGWPHPSFIVGDEVWAWSDREPTLLGAMMTAMLKNPDCRYRLVIKQRLRHPGWPSWTATSQTRKRRGRLEAGDWSRVRRARRSTRLSPWR